MGDHHVSGAKCWMKPSVPMGDADAHETFWTGGCGWFQLNSKKIVSVVWEPKIQSGMRSRHRTLGGDGQREPKEARSLSVGGVSVRALLTLFVSWSFYETIFNSRTVAFKLINQILKICCSHFRLVNSVVNSPCLQQIFNSQNPWLKSNGVQAFILFLWNNRTAVVEFCTSLFAVSSSKQLQIASIHH